MVIQYSGNQCKKKALHIQQNTINYGAKASQSTIRRVLLALASFWLMLNTTAPSYARNIFSLFFNLKLWTISLDKIYILLRDLFI